MKSKLLLSLVLMFCLVATLTTAGVQNEASMNKYTRSNSVSFEKAQLTNDARGDCFTLQDQDVCFKTNLAADFYTLELPNGNVKFGWKVNNPGAATKFIVTSNVDLGVTDFIDWSDFDNAGLDYEIDVNTITVNNPDHDNWWFDPVINVSSNSGATSFGNQRKIVQLSNGTIYTTFSPNSGGQPNIVLAWSGDDGATWTQENLTKEGASPIDAYPSMVLDETNNALHITWRNTADGVDNNDDIIYVQWNLSTNARVAAPIKIVTAASSSNEALNPDIDIFDNGTIIIPYEQEDAVTVCRDIKFKTCDSSCELVGSWSTETIIMDCSANGGYQQGLVDVATNGTTAHFTWAGRDSIYTTRDQIMYISCNGTSCGTREVIDGDDSLIHANPSMIIKNNKPHIVSSTTLYNLTYRDLAYSNKTSGSWNAWKEIYTSENDSQQQPTISEDGTNIYIGWLKVIGANNCIGLINSTDIGATWGSISNVTNSCTTNSVNYAILSWQNNYQSSWNLMLLYNKQNASNYNVTFEILSTGSGAANETTHNSTTQITTPIMETTPTTYNITFEWNTSSVDWIDNVTFYWNGTAQTTGFDSNTTNTSQYNVSITLPLVGTNPTAINTYWSYVINYTNGTNTTENTSTQSQSIQQMNLFNCTDGTAGQVLNFSIIDEQTNSTLSNASISVAFTFWRDGGSNTLNRQFNWQTNESNNFSFCVSPVTQELDVDAIIEYSAEGYSTRNYYFDARDVNATVMQNISLYLIDENLTSNIILKVRTLTDQKVANATITIERYYPGSGQYIAVEVAKTNYDGETIAALVAYSVQYKFIVAYEGVTYFVSKPTEIFRTELTFRINLDTYFEGSYDESTQIYTRLTFTNSSQTWTWTYNDPNNVITQACLDVYKRTARGDTLICASCSSSIAATLTCTESATMTGHYYAIGKINTSSQFSEYTIDVLWQLKDKLRAHFGIQGVFYAVMIVGTLSMIGAAMSIRACVMFGLGGFLFTFTIGLISLTWGSMITIVILGGIIIFKTKT